MAVNGETYRTIFQRGKRFTVSSAVLQKMAYGIHLVEVTRKSEGRNPNPSYAIIDSQSVKTVYASEQIGFDGGKKTKEEKDT